MTSDELSLKERAAAWDTVFDVCQSLGMEIRRTGVESVTGFIRESAAALRAEREARERAEGLLGRVVSRVKAESYLEAGALPDAALHQLLPHLPPDLAREILRHIAG